MVTPKYAFCESVTATSDSPWHIRKLTEKGFKFGGGADTKALCGRVVSWDRVVPVPDNPTGGYCCQRCIESYSKKNGAW